MAEWRTVFWVTFGVFVITTIVYVIWASGEVQPWNEPEDQDLAEDDEAKEHKAIESPTEFTTTIIGATQAPIDLSETKALEAAESAKTKSN